MGPSKALLIGINYRGTGHELRGCINDVKNMSAFLTSRAGYDPSRMIIMTEDHAQEDPKFNPTGRNILAGFQWLIRDARQGDRLFLHYSGHGSQVKDTDGRTSGMDDTIVPLDYEQNGQINSDVLHKVLVSPLPPGVRLTVVMDCCHSGSILELPFHFRLDAQGNVVKVDLVKQAMSAFTDIGILMNRGIPTGNKLQAAQDLFRNVKSIWNELKHPDEQQQQQQASGPGLEQDDFGHVDWTRENREVFCFSGCLDEQTSADATIGGTASGAMSWALLTTLQQQPNQTYSSMLQNTRGLLAQKYSQVPQLSVGREGENLDAPFAP